MKLKHSVAFIGLLLGACATDQAQPTAVVFEEAAG